MPGLSVLNGQTVVVDEIGVTPAGRPAHFLPIRDRHGSGLRNGLTDGRPRLAPVTIDRPPWTGSANADALAALLGLQSEHDWLDYKRQCDLSTTRGVVELAKDVGAMMISGGYILIGADDNGRPAGDVEHLESLACQASSGSGLAITGCSTRSMRQSIRSGSRMPGTAARLTAVTDYIALQLGTKWVMASLVRALCVNIRTPPAMHHCARSCSPRRASAKSPGQVPRLRA